MQCGRATVATMAARKRQLREHELRALLVGCGFRVTQKRMAILRELTKLRAPTSHAELSHRLAGSGLDRVTIYRNLHSLTEAGVLVKTRLGDNVWRFELPSSHPVEHGNHPHFVCRECGRVACLPADSVSLRGEAARNQVAEVQLRGRCRTCARTRHRSDQTIATAP